MNYYLTQKENNRKPKKSFFKKYINFDLILVVPILIMATLIVMVLAF
jgi:hypothetical protein